MNVTTIAGELKIAQDELNAAKAAVDRIPALTDRVSDLESALIECAKGEAVDVDTPNTAADEFEEAFEETANRDQEEVVEKKSPDMAAFYDDTSADEKLRAADEALKEIEALDDEPTGNMTSAVPNGGLPGNLY